MRCTIIALALTLVACAPSAPPGYVPRGAFDSCDSGSTVMPESVVHVYAGDGGPVSMCTGVVISPTEVLTAGHCLEDTTYAYVTHDELTGSDGLPIAYPVTEAVINGPAGEDFALLRVRTPVPPARLQHPITAPRTGPGAGRVQIAGYGCYPEGRVRSGFLLPRDFPGIEARPYVACACRGDSGGPVFDDYGNVVGVLTHSDLSARGHMTDITVLSSARLAMIVLLHTPAAAP